MMAANLAEGHGSATGRPVCSKTLQKKCRGKRHPTGTRPLIPPARSRLFRMTRLLVRLFLLLAVLAALIAGALAWYAQRPLHWSGDAVEYTLRPGTALRQAARQIEAAGVPVDGRLLGLIGRIVKEQMIERGVIR